MENIINVTYETTGQTTAVNEMGMRPMQARALCGAAIRSISF